jgi:hypothetical protein
MSKTSNLVRGALAAASLLIAGGAFAEGTFTPELGFGVATGKHVIQGDGRGDAHDPAFTAAFGYEMDNGLGARLMAIGDFDVSKTFVPEQRSFDNFVGVQVTDKIRLADAFNLRGGIGIGRSNLEGDAVGHQLVTDGVLSLGLQWRPGPHYAMEVRADHLTTTGTTVFALQFQVPF